MKRMTPEELKNYGDTLPLGYTYDSMGNELTCKTSNGYWREYTYDSMGNELTCKTSNGYWHECTYDTSGKELTYKDSDGYWRGFSDIAIDAERARLKQVRKNLKASKSK